MEFKINLESAVLGLIAAQDKVMRACEGYGKTAAVKMEGYAKENAPWTDRTGNARQTITGACGWGAPGSISAKTEGTGKFVVRSDYSTFGMDAAEMKNLTFSSRTTGPVKQEIMRAQTSRNYGGGPGSNLVIVLSGNMDYSPHLELRNDGKYAILWPTVNALQGEVITGFAAALRRTL